MRFEKIHGADKPKSEREQSQRSTSHNSPAEAERQNILQEKEAERQGLLARVRAKIFGNVSGREHSQGKAGDMEPRAFGNISGREHSQGKAGDIEPRAFGNISGREHSQGKAGQIEPRSFGNISGREHSQGKAGPIEPRAFGNISGREHSQGKAGDIEPRAFGNMPKSYLPEEEQERRFKKASDEKAMRNAPRGGGNVPGPILSEEEIRVEAQKIWDARKGLPGKFKKTQEIGGIKAYDNGNAWSFKVGFDKMLMVSKDHPRLQEIAAKIAQAQQAIDAGDEAAENKFLAQAARLEQGKK